MHLSEAYFDFKYLMKDNTHFELKLLSHQGSFIIKSVERELNTEEKDFWIKSLPEIFQTNNYLKNILTKFKWVADL